MYHRREWRSARGHRSASLLQHQHYQPASVPGAQCQHRVLVIRDRSEQLPADGQPPHRPRGQHAEPVSTSSGTTLERKNSQLIQCQNISISYFIFIFKLFH